jgi:hypothetical protein
MLNKAVKFTARVLLLGALVVFTGFQALAYEPIFTIYEPITPTLPVIGLTQDNEENVPRGTLEKFLNFTGTVTEINEIEDRLYIHAIDSEGLPTVFIKDFLTFVLGDAPKVGDIVTGYYDASLPVPMIWPPIYTARLLVVGDHGEIKLERFRIAEGLENALMSESGELILRFDETTPIMLQDGQNIREIVTEQQQSILDFMDGRLLAVTYGPTSRSWPPQTIPGIDESLSITVLFERAVHLPGFGFDMSLDLGFGFDTGLDSGFAYPIKWAYNYGISVEGRMVDALWQEVDGAYYVPFRAVVNLLRFGNTVYWCGEAQVITVYNGTETISFSIGSNHFQVGPYREVVLSHPAILLYDTTYVPFQFFSRVFGLNNAYMHEGQIVIDNTELMQ